MKSLSQLALFLVLTTMPVCIGVALSRLGQANQSGRAAREGPEPKRPDSPDESTGRMAPDAERAANSKRMLIREEVAKLCDHPWAGEYYAGDGLGTNTVILLAPNAGYLFEWHGCLGVYDRNYGTVTEKGGRLILSFTFENSQEGFRGVAPELRPIRWGERRYLIPVDDIVRFCNHVNQGTEPRSGSHGFHFLRQGDESKVVAGIPKLPKEYVDYLLSEPVEATVTAVGVSELRPSRADWKFKDTKLILNAGVKRGLKVGMELVVTVPDGVVESATITKVEEGQSEATMTQIGEEAVGPQVGWRVSTRARWRSGTK